MCCLFVEYSQVVAKLKATAVSVIIDLSPHSNLFGSQARVGSQPLSWDNSTLSLFAFQHLAFKVLTLKCVRCYVMV